MTAMKVVAIVENNCTIDPITTLDLTKECLHLHRPLWHEETDHHFGSDDEIRQVCHQSLYGFSW